MRSQYRFLRNELERQKGLIALCCLVLFAQSLFLVLFPLPIRFALDHALTANVHPSELIKFFSFEISRANILNLAVLASLIIGIGMTGLEFLDERFTNFSVSRLVTSVRLNLLNELVTRQFSYLEGKRKVDLLGRISGDTQNLELFVSSSFVVLFRSLPSLIFAVASMFIINTRFALLMLLLIPAFYISITIISNRIKLHEKDYRSKTNKFEHETMQTLSAMSLIKSLRGEGDAISRLKHGQNEINKSFLKSKFFGALLNGTFSGSRHVIRALVLLLGGYAILEGNLTLGTLFAFVSYLEALNRPVGEIANFISRYGKASASLERIQELFEEQKNFPEVDGTLEISTAQNSMEHSTTAIEFEQVGFKYSQGEPILKNLNLHLQKNRLIALVGSSGVGKSTFIKLFNRLNDPTSGRILINGIPLQDIRLNDLRRHVCLISQDPFFLSISVRDNLTLALKESVTEAQIWQALEQVNAAEFVRQLPQGLETMIGEAGVQLSGGQSKRLSLARGFLRAASASIFVFDEPTSGLDPVSATHVMKSLRQLADCKELVLFSTHRVQEFDFANEVLFFHKQQEPLLESHSLLLETNLYYRQLLQAEVQA
ncbi:ABC transporter ATP-binding protein [Bdellovibrio svalbardensis]|uniref:ABC transporter ATP-binding protein/permease n=1 Tax=Bdellovibrio svalbardensis TaxID=2972972 RepID=A0ABT6DHF6_9BACT|nr:ABC transporter ATP-binding protein [Bdellovibrio svalbardensis]MDG0816284.1 ABC transporter ATP-binding protein/permease [Bdellovibrio svalbardensis]